MKAPRVIKVDPRQAAYAENRRRRREAAERWLATRALPGSPVDGSGKREASDGE